MSSSGLNRVWSIITIVLLVAIAAGGFVIWRKYIPEKPVEILISHPQEIQAKIYIGGAVNSPGIFSLQSGDTIESLVKAAGGLDSTANLSTLELYVTSTNTTQQSQKVDINTADVWLLEALPGIGQTLAQRIVDYRKKNGSFNNTDELLRVPGVGTTTYGRIKSLVTVADR